MLNGTNSPSPSRYTFLITGLVYASACLVYLPLLYLVPRKEKEAANASVTASAVGTVMHCDATMSAQRLLGPGELTDAVLWADFGVSQPNFPAISMVSQRAEYSWVIHLTRVDSNQGLLG